MVELSSVLLRDLAVKLDNETCAKGLNCSFTGNFVDCSLSISLSLISGEEFTYNFFLDVLTLVMDIFNEKKIYLNVKSVSTL